MKYLMLLLVCGCSIILKGQPKDFEPEIYFGVKGGATFAKVRFYPSVRETYLDGNTGGLVFRYISEPHIGFQIEANYIQKGWREDSTGYSRRLNYVSLPVMTHVNMGNKAFRFTLNFGPEIGYMISENESFNPPKTVSPGDPGYREYFGKPVDTQFDFLFTVGFGVEYHFKKGGAIVFDTRGFYSLPNLFDKNNYPYSISQSNGIESTLAYVFQFRKKPKK